MAIYLVQHGKCNPEETDPERSLTPAGIEEVRRIAGVARGYGVGVTRIRHSGKKRAQQTADMLAAALGGAPVETMAGMNPNDDVARFAATLANDGCMYVGHLPFMERLTSHLVCGDSGKTVFKFQNGGIVCLDEDPAKGWFIKWTLMPRIE